MSARRSPVLFLRAALAARWLLGWLCLVAGAGSARALPSFARQMNMQCAACHTEFPLLNAFGRQFKLAGYTLSTGESRLPPIAVMLQPSFTQTQAGQPDGAAPGFSPNRNLALTQASLFYAGRLLGPYAGNLLGKDAAAVVDKIGIFSQTTYNGIAHTWAWDNTELRYADTGKFAGRDAVYGVYLNNNPTMQDPWNSTPAWGFPFTGSGLAPVPAAAPLISGALAHQVGGIGAYMMVANTVYFEVGGYHTLGPGFQRSVGTAPDGESQVPGIAPYWRLAVEKSTDSSTWEVGTFGLAAGTYPGRDGSAGEDRTADFGLDSQYQWASARNNVTVLASAIYEHSRWDASQALGNTANASERLWNEKVTFDYLFDRTYGAAVQLFNLSGQTDALRYPGSATGSPNSNGAIFQLNYLPINKSGGPAFWPKSNVKLSVQYIVYRRFDGGSRNFDGAGRNASDNNTLYLEAWIAF